MTNANRENFDFQSFHQDIETIRRKYGVAIGYYFVDDVEDYLNYVHCDSLPDGADVRSIAEWIWDNTRLRNKIQDTLNSSEVVADLMEEGFHEYEQHEQNNATTHE